MCVNVVDVCVICEWSLFMCVRVMEVSESESVVDM